MLKRLAVLVGLVVLAGCAESATEPEAPAGWQVVVETNGESPKTLAAVVSNTDLSVISALVRDAGSGGQAFIADLQESDTLLVGYSFWAFSNDTASLRLTGNMRMSPTSRYPIELHEFTILVDITKVVEGKEVTVVRYRVEEREPAKNDSFVFLYNDTIPVSGAPESYYYGFFLLRAVTCKREGRNTLQSNGIVIQTGGLIAASIVPPDITVTCHRAVSSASVRGGPLP